ncbi:hypothetical protein [Haloarcula montana]|uniref:hypothetical protein n=1 Tax=Haloarcula montana TaxID=3111776 RepID=UPI002D781B48|nr:hypothetical protein [Haloarcula sp. GH36]
MRRREFLAALSCGSGLLAGCTDSGGRERVTPAPVPTVTTTEPPRRDRTVNPCPALPRDAEQFVCSSVETSGRPIQLTASRDVFPVDTLSEVGKRIRFVLSNSSLVPFSTGPDWWTLARKDPDGWTVVHDGNHREHTDVGPSDSFVWTLGLNGSVESGPAHRDVVVDTRNGRHAFVVTGYHRDGDLLAVIALFELRQRWTDTRKE